MTLPSFRHSYLLLVALLLVVSPVMAETRPKQPEFNFDSMLAHENLWSMTQADFQKQNTTLPFTWTSQARDSARAAWPGMKLFGLPVVEVIARFEKGHLKIITANFYTRGDIGEVPKETFERILDASKAALTNFTKVKARERGKDPSNAVRAEGLFWDTDAARFLLEYSARREVKRRNIPFRAEFVRVEVLPPASGAALLSSGALAPVSKPRFSGLSKVKRQRASGDVFIQGVPMVDQGYKGYCVVASTERVLRYYGTDVDANELAQIADTSSFGGTSLDGMRAAMRKLTTRLKIRFREIERMEVRDVLAIIKDYNRAAKKAGEREVGDPGFILDLGFIFSRMKPNLLKETRLAKATEMERFFREIQLHVEQGIPLLWSVQLGILREGNIPQDAGGHMRLVIGYNGKTKEVIFSDSWGAGHERKRMPLEDAWTITTGLMKIEPQS